MTDLFVYNRLLLLFMLLIISWFRVASGYMCDRTWLINRQFFEDHSEYVMFGLIEFEEVSQIGASKRKHSNYSSVYVIAQDRRNNYIKTFSICENSTHKVVHQCPDRARIRLFILNATTADVLYVYPHSDPATEVIALERFTLTSDGLTSELISTSSTNPLRRCLSFDKVTYDVYSDGYFFQGSCPTDKAGEVYKCPQYLRKRGKQDAQQANLPCTSTKGTCGEKKLQCVFDPILYEKKPVIGRDEGNADLTVYSCLACNYYFSTKTDPSRKKDSSPMVVVSFRVTNLKNDRAVRCFKVPENGPLLYNVLLWNTTWALNGGCQELTPELTLKKTTVRTTLASTTHTPIQRHYSMTSATQSTAAERIIFCGVSILATFLMGVIDVALLTLSILLCYLTSVVKSASVTE